MFKIFKSPIKVKTPDGYKEAYGIRKIKKEAINIMFEQSKYIKASLNHKFIEKGKEILAKDLKVGNYLSGYKIIKIKNIGKINVYDLTDVNGSIYYTNDILSHNCAFLGSATTLISTEALKLMAPEEPKSLDKIFSGVKIYGEVIKGHNYLVGVDPAKDGIDSFSIQVLDITTFPFKQVASAKLDVDYLIMPEHLETLGLYYNTAFIVIENNEGAGQSIADSLYFSYQYENMYRDRDSNDKGYKKYFGFRTTKKTRPLILNMMKIFIEEGKLNIIDKNTIDEFFNFIKSDNVSEKFKAEEGYHDDMIMSLAICFAPFMHIKAFDDRELFLNALHIDLEDGVEGLKTDEYYSMLDIGGFSDGNEDTELNRYDILEKLNNTFDEDEEFELQRSLNNQSEF